jgi:hypothetical protein
MLLQVIYEKTKLKVYEARYVIDVSNKEYMQGYLKSDSLVFVSKNGPKYGWDNTLNNYLKSYPDRSAMGNLTFDI